MAQPLKITIELLKYIQAEGYQSLLLKFGKQNYIPRKEGADELMGNSSTVPLKEDEILSVSDAINFFHELELENQYIFNIFEIESISNLK